MGLVAVFTILCSGSYGHKETPQAASKEGFDAC